MVAFKRDTTPGTPLGNILDELAEYDLQEHEAARCKPDPQPATQPDGKPVLAGTLRLSPESRYGTLVVFPPGRTQVQVA